jgi:Na+-translocating ferredoxin:NAD+ oxidoreductase RnfG subunit
MIKKLLNLLAVFVLICVTALSVNHTLFDHSFVENAAQSEETLSDDESYAVTFPENSVMVINTSTLCDAQGYAGKTPLQVTITEGKISDIELLSNSETPHFVERATALFDNWIGKTPAEVADMKVDAVSGATYSSNALIANMNAAVETYGNTPSPDPVPAMPWKMWVALGVTLIACIVPLFVKNRIYNRVQLVVNVVVLGFWCGQFINYTNLMRLISYGPSFPESLTLICMVIAAFIYPLFGKREHYCNHICPLGSAQILVASLCHYKIKISRKTLQILDTLRKVIWAVLLLLIWFDIYAGWIDYELFSAFIVESAPIGVTIAAILFVGLSSVVARPYCRFLCPTGSLVKAL